MEELGRTEAVDTVSIGRIQGVSLLLCWFQKLARCILVGSGTHVWIVVWLGFVQFNGIGRDSSKASKFGNNTGWHGNCALIGGPLPLRSCR